MAYTHYYRTRLMRAEVPIYNALVQAVKRFDREIHLPAMPAERVPHLITAVDYDHPELFYADFHQVTFATSPWETVISMRYHYSYSRAQALQAQINAQVYTILTQAETLPLVEKELFLHDYLINHGEYGDIADRKRDAHSIVGALVDGRCVCEGFAKAFKLLCDRAKIPAIIAVGQLQDSAGEEWHAWNIVRIDGHAYHVDVTHDLVKEYRCASRAYFNLSDAEMLCDRRPDPDFTLPACPDSGAVIPLISSKAQLMEHLRLEARLGKASTEVRLNRGFTIQEIRKIVFDGPAVYDLWANWMSSLRYSEGNRSVVIHWRDCVTMRRAAARTSQVLHRLLGHKRTGRMARAC